MVELSPCDQPFVASDGVPLRYFERRATGPGSGTVVLLHSLFFSGRMFEALAECLPVGLRLVCPDHRGQGGSAGPTTTKPTMDRLSRDVESLVCDLGEGPVHLVGSSMGGYVALALAARRPDLLLSCTLSCCTAAAEAQPERFANLVARLRRDGGAPHVEDLTATMFGHRFIDEGSDALARWRQHFAALDSSIADAAHEVFARPSCIEALATWRVPLLLVSGALDRAKRPADMQFIADRVPGSRHIVLPSSGHTPPIEDPRRFAEALIAFWQCVPSTPRSMQAHRT